MPSVMGPTCPQQSRENSTNRGQNVSSLSPGDRQGLVIIVMGHFVLAEYRPVLERLKSLLKSAARPTQGR